MAETLKTKVAIIEKEISQINALFGKLDSTIDRMTEVSISVNQMLAMHETQIKQTAEDAENLFHLIEKRRMENDENLKELHSRITTGNKEITQDMNAHIIQILQAIEEVKDVMIAREKSVRNDQSDLEDRLAEVEKKQYFMMGVGAVFGFIAGAFDWISQIFN